MLDLRRFTVVFVCNSRENKNENTEKYRNSIILWYLSCPNFGRRKWTTYYNMFRYNFLTMFKILRGKNSTILMDFRVDASIVGRLGCLWLSRIISSISRARCRPSFVWHNVIRNIKLYFAYYCVFSGLNE